jgi:hypothetical protein
LEENTIPLFGWRDLWRKYSEDIGNLFCNAIEDKTQLRRYVGWLQGRKLIRVEPSQDRQSSLLASMAKVQKAIKLFFAKLVRTQADYLLDLFEVSTMMCFAACF